METYEEFYARQKAKSVPLGVSFREKGGQILPSNDPYEASKLQKFQADKASKFLSGVPAQPVKTTQPTTTPTAPSAPKPTLGSPATPVPSNISSITGRPKAPLSWENPRPEAPAVSQITGKPRGQFSWEVQADAMQNALADFKMRQMKQNPF
jgi:hypothetical protein